ncbi:MAG TPA: NRDE family protein [Burkholderiaceae bacterium]|nr:NRDE family protein [Burkholderiaceae bacterium]
MCLIGLALDAHPRHALVIAANRDEFHDRPAAPLAWWQPAGNAPALLSGRDLEAGGTWMGVSRTGRLGLLTNVRAPHRRRHGAPSRGVLVTDWLATGRPADAVWPDFVARGCNPFNLIGGDLATSRWWWADDRSQRPRPLGPGVFGLSNAALDTPWPKVERLKGALAAALSARSNRHREDADALRDALWNALADRRGAPDGQLPDTGVGLERERWLAPAFIAAPEGHYGTRCSTVLLGERIGAGWQLSVWERSFDRRGALQGERHESWRWSP